MSLNILKLSKTVSYILRHDIDSLKSIDSEGWIMFPDLIHSLKREGLLDVTEEDVVAMVEHAEKRRHEIADGKIRAYNGHSSIMNKIIKNPTVPPEFLYHGTKIKYVESILNEGLKAMGRQYVHLSGNLENAQLIAERRPGESIVFTIRALEAFNKNIAFYEAVNNIWLTEYVPLEFLICKI